MSALRLLLRAGLAAVTPALLLPAASSLAAVVVDASASDVATFAGSGCGSTSTASLRLPAGVFDVDPTTPDVGSILVSADDDTTPVARVTAVTVAPGSVTWTASATDAACTDPVYAELGWQSSDTQLRVTYARRISRLYLPAACAGPRYRPISIIVACGDGNLQLRRLRWKGWNTRVATARGTALMNDCTPYCAAGRFHRLGVRVTASQIRQCRGVYQYTRLRYRLERPSRQFARSGGTSLAWTCSS